MENKGYNWREHSEYYVASFSPAASMHPDKAKFEKFFSQKFNCPIIMSDEILGHATWVGTALLPYLVVTKYNCNDRLLGNFSFIDLLENGGNWTSK